MKRLSRALLALACLAGLVGGLVLLGRAVPSLVPFTNVLIIALSIIGAVLVMFGIIAGLSYLAEWVWYGRAND